MSKYRVFRDVPGGGMGGGIREDRILVLTQGQHPPEGAVKVPDDTPEYDWKPAHFPPPGQEG